jgi:hypothetical protein
VATRSVSKLTLAIVYSQGILTGSLGSVVLLYMDFADIFFGVVMPFEIVMLAECSTVPPL